MLKVKNHKNTGKTERKKTKKVEKKEKKKEKLKSNQKNFSVKIFFAIRSDLNEKKEEKTENFNIQLRI